MGPCAATVMSSRLTAEVRRGGVRRVQEYARGRLGGATVRDGVEQGVREHLGSWLDRHPERAAAVIGRITRDADPDEG